MSVVLAYANETQKPKEKPLPFPFVASILDSSAAEEGVDATSKKCREATFERSGRVRIASAIARSLKSGARHVMILIASPAHWSAHRVPQVKTRLARLVPTCANANNPTGYI
jgi:hypothetical protein